MGDKDLRVGPAGGSFSVSKEALERQIRAKRAEEAAQKDLEKAQESAERQREDTEEQKRLDEIDSLLPPMVMCSLGQVPYSAFRRVYESIYKQVEEKDHLARGFCIYAFKAAPDLEVTVRSFKTGEMRVIRKFAPPQTVARLHGIVIDTQPMDMAGYLDKDAEFQNMRLLFGITSWAGQELPSLSMPGKSLDDWMKRDEIKDRLSWISDLPEPLTDLISGVLSDVAVAYRFALQENLKNQFALP